MPAISFFEQDISFKIPFPRKTASWLQAVATSEHQKIKSISYIFCSERFLLSLNKQYLNHSTYTDILSFDYSEGGGIDGEIYISVPRVRANAKQFNQVFDTELRRVVAHGLLHFLGYRDKTYEEKKLMRLKEEACLSLWK